MGCDIHPVDVCAVHSTKLEVLFIMNAYVCGGPGPLFYLFSANFTF